MIKKVILPCRLSGRFKGLFDRPSHSKGMATISVVDCHYYIKFLKFWLSFSQIDIAMSK